MRGEKRNHVSCFASGAFVIIAFFVVMLMLYGCGGVASTPSSMAQPTTPPPPATTPPPPVTPAPASITTYHYDVMRTGANPNETTLTPSNVNPSTFGKLASFDVDGQIYGQPLYLPNVSIGGAGRNVVFVATEHDSVYAFDADAKTTTPLWHVSFINPGAGVTTVNSTTDFQKFGVIYDDIYPEIGITSTPVIDTSTGTIYVVAKTKESGKFVQRLHALDITTGAEKFGGPTVIQASIPGRGVVNDGNGNIVFDPLVANQRSALLLLNGKIWLTFASHGDFDPFLGWILIYDAQTLKQVVAFAPTPDGAGGGIWETGNGPAVDSAGNVYVGVGNGDYTAGSGGRDYGDSFLKLTLSGSTLQVADWFTPFNFQDLNNMDHDIGSGGPILLPDQPSSPAHLLVGGSKAGQLYVVNRDTMGHNHASDNSQAVQVVTLPGGLFGNPAVWTNHLYIQSLKSPLQCYTINAGQLAAPSQASEVFSYPGASPTVSSNGSSNGIVWTIDASNWDNGPAVLHAYDATDCAKELYNSAQASGGRDTAGGTAVKFSVPTVMNGKVYVSGGGKLTVYGLLP